MTLIPESRTEPLGTVLLAAAPGPWRLEVAAALRQAGFHCVCADDASTAVDYADRLRPDTALVHEALPGGALGALAASGVVAPRMATVMAATAPNGSDLLAVLRVGGRGYVDARVAPESLVEVIRAVAQGEAALPRRLVRALADEFRARAVGRRSSRPLIDSAELTAREWQVLDLMAAGLNTVQIASRLNITSGTVRSHVHSVVHKFRLTSRAQVISLLEDRAGTATR